MLSASVERRGFIVNWSLQPVDTIVKPKSVQNLLSKPIDQAEDVCWAGSIDGAVNIWWAKKKKNLHTVCWNEYPKGAQIIYYF